MKIDAKSGRIFSNIVAEYNVEFDEEHPLKIVENNTKNPSTLSESHYFYAIPIILNVWHGVSGCLR